MKDKNKLGFLKKPEWIASFLVVIWAFALSSYAFTSPPSGCTPGNCTNPLQVNFSDQTVSVSATPTSNTHVANKAYVDEAVSAAGSSDVIQLSCAWRYDYREGTVDTGAATNWSCTPPTCPSGWTDAGVISSEPVSVACSGYTYCSFDDINATYHPVTVGRSVRYCLR